MDGNALDLLLSDDPDSIHAYAEELRAQDPEIADVLVKLSHCYRNYSDFEVKHGPEAVRDEASRLIRTVRDLFDEELDFGAALRLVRCLFICKVALPGQKGEDLFQHVLEHHLPKRASGKIRTRAPWRP
jgi:hypothetical protein